MSAKCTCSKCQKTMDEANFYTYKNGIKTEMCKKCLTMHVDPFAPETFLWLLEKMDVPYVPAEWNILRDREFARDPTKVSGMVIFGKYLSKMKLKQWKGYCWADTERLQLEAQVREEKQAQKDEELRIKKAKGEITEAEYKTLASTESQNEAYMNAPPGTFIGPNNLFDENKFIKAEDLPDPAASLTNEDKIYLAMKWGRTYTPSDWVELERNYTEMMNSFDIQDADTANTLIVLCKTNLKMNQYIDAGDIDGFQKLSKVYESLRKSAKFTAAQNKEERGDAVDCVGELIAMAERDGGFIPRFATDVPQDKIDITLQDMQAYTKKLITQDLGFGQQIEAALKKIQIQKEMNEREENNTESYEELQDQDHEEYNEVLQEQIEQDKKIYEEEADE